MNTCYEAAIEGDFKRFKYLHELGHNIEDSCMIHAIRLNHVEMVDYISRYQINKEEIYTLEAVDEGRVDCLKALYQAGYPLHPDATIRSIKRKKLDCLIYIYEQTLHIHVPDHKLITYSVETGCLSIITYLIKQGVNFLVDQTIEVATFYITRKAVSLSFIKRLVLLGCPVSVYAVQLTLQDSVYNKFKYLYKLLSPEKQLLVWTEVRPSTITEFINRVNLDDPFFRSHLVYSNNLQLSQFPLLETKIQNKRKEIELLTQSLIDILQSIICMNVIRTSINIYI